MNGPRDRHGEAGASRPAVRFSRICQQPIAMLSNILIRPSYVTRQHGRQLRLHMCTDSCGTHGVHNDQCAAQTQVPICASHAPAANTANRVMPAVNGAMAPWPGGCKMAPATERVMSVGFDWTSPPWVSKPLGGLPARCADPHSGVHALATPPAHWLHSWCETGVPRRRCASHHTRRRRR